MDTLRRRFSLSMMCRVLQVSRSGFYAWRRRPPSKRRRQEGRLQAEIRAAHERARWTYGPERLQRDLAAHGVRVGVHRIKRIRRQLGLRCRQKRRYRATTDSRHALPVAPNVLGPCFRVQRPNQAWVGDITDVATDEGWLYLAGLKDLHSGRIVGYAMANHRRQSLVSQALEQALQTRRPRPGLICHSDRGSQYCAWDYQQRLHQHGLQPSMSRRGNCYDNAPIESFWGTLKTELVHSRRFQTRQQAIDQITQYIELVLQPPAHPSPVGLFITRRLRTALLSISIRQNVIPWRPFLPTDLSMGTHQVTRPVTLVDRFSEVLSGSP